MWGGERGGGGGGEAGVAVVSGGGGGLSEVDIHRTAEHCGNDWIGRLAFPVRTRACNRDNGVPGEKQSVRRGSG